jgi:hypothetical protein
MHKPRIQKPPPEKPCLPHPEQGQIRQALAIQRLLCWTMWQPETSTADLSRLALAWSSVRESLRVLRGLPLPGQLRPDLDPLQLAKALKRQRDRSMPTIETSAIAQFSEERDTKESIPKQGGDHGVGVGGVKPEPGA